MLFQEPRSEASRSEAVQGDFAVPLPNYFIRKQMLLMKKVPSSKGLGKRLRTLPSLSGQPRQPQTSGVSLPTFQRPNSCGVKNTAHINRILWSLLTEKLAKLKQRWPVYSESSSYWISHRSKSAHNRPIPCAVTAHCKVSGNNMLICYTQRCT